jgi:hypothetical protein
MPTNPVIGTQLPSFTLHKLDNLVGSLSAGVAILIGSTQESTHELLFANSGFLSLLGISNIGTADNSLLIPTI